jgi:hypothetical protein
MSGEFDECYTAYQTRRSALRRAVRRLYLRNAAAQLRGPTLDLGCGVGELLKRLPPGSKGLEYNRASVEHCRARGLDVDWYDGYADDWRLTCISGQDRPRSMIISHVLEHLHEPMDVLHKLLLAAGRIGIERVLVIVPGRAGYASDATHRTFVDAGMLRDAAVIADTRFRVCSERYFPGDARYIGNWMKHHELQVLYGALPASIAQQIKGK